MHDTYTSETYNGVNTLAQAEANWLNCEAMAQHYTRLAQAWRAEYWHAMAASVTDSTPPEVKEAMLDPGDSFSRWLVRVFGTLDAEADMDDGGSLASNWNIQADPVSPFTNYRYRKGGMIDDDEQDDDEQDDDEQDDDEQDDDDQPRGPLEPIEYQESVVESE